MDVTSEDGWRNPPLSCDIVMKGGITSGVVYPGAVVKLARRYRFRSIGGASAGALAAVAAAAAEHGRASGGFARLAEVPRELASTVDGAPFILTMFQPERSTRPLFRAALAFQRFGAVRGIVATMVSFWRFPLVALALVVVAVVLAVLGAIPWWLAVALIALAPWTLVVGVGRDALAAFGAVARNDFGLCRLGPGSGKDTVLTVWLHRLVQHLCGRAASREAADGTTPLTFADLWGVPPLRGNETEAELADREKLIDRLGWNASERVVDLQVITTNLSFSRPMRIPTVTDRWRPKTSEDGGLLFDPAEWRDFFPKEIVEHMEAHAAEPDEEAAAIIRAQEPGRRLLYFPGGAHLPIVVAARMSLSFPVLISTVPLWQIKYRRDGRHRLTRLAFSDGGISSNFPVHFFDAPLPTRPTFALNLAGFDRDEDPDLDDPSQAVQDPVGVNERARDAWKEPRSMKDFAIAIKDAMQNWRDNAQARMPGFRERVIHIKLASGEGGLNLAMDEQKVSRLIARGEYAGGRLIDLFSGPEDGPLEQRPHWNDHRYARFRILMSSLERLFQGFQSGYSAEPDAVTKRFDERIAAGLEPPYPLTQGRLAAATAKTEAYRALADVVETLDDDDVPRPRAAVRLMPPL